jgi:hypothetical protein
MTIAMRPASQRRLPSSPPRPRSRKPMSSQGRQCSTTAPAPDPRILVTEHARRRRSRRPDCAPLATAPTHPTRTRPSNPHRSRPTNTAPFLSAVSSLGGFRTPAPALTRPSCKGPASKTLHLLRRPRSRFARSASRRFETSPLRKQRSFPGALANDFKATTRRAAARARPPLGCPGGVMLSPEAFARRPHLDGFASLLSFFGRARKFIPRV